MSKKHSNDGKEKIIIPHQIWLESTRLKKTELKKLAEELQAILTKYDVTMYGWDDGYVYVQDVDRKMRVPGYDYETVLFHVD
jgi:hypothetical protein